MFIRQQNEEVFMYRRENMNFSSLLSHMVLRIPIYRNCVHRARIFHILKFFY